MNYTTLLQHLNAAGVTLMRDGNDLILSGDALNLPDMVIEGVRQMKQALLEHVDALVGVQAIPRRRELWAVQNRCPASASQRLLWLANQGEADAAAYNIATALSARGPLDLDRFSRAANSIVARHEILRTSFHDSADGLQQHIEPQLTIPVNIDDSGLEGRDEVVKSWLRRRAAQPFDLSRPPLLRIDVLRTAVQEHVISVVVHHIIFDAWSSRTFFHELIQAYCMDYDAEDVPLPPLPIQFADFAFWQHHERQLDDEQRQLAFWSQKLANAPAVTTLPYDFPVSQRPGSAGAAVKQALTPQLGSAVASFCAEHNTTLFNVAAAALGALLAKYTSHDEVCIGIPVSTRNRAELLPLIGFLVNTAVLRMPMRENITFTELLDQCAQSMHAVHSNLDVPFEEVVQHVRPERSHIHTPLFQVMLSVLHSADTCAEITGMKFELIERHIDTVKYDLVLNVHEQSGRLTCSLEYKTELFERATAERFLENFKTLLANAIAAPEVPLCDLNHIADAELDLQLREWNSTAVPIPDECIHAEFERRCHASPHSVALVAGSDTLTYSQLNTLANRLAASLVARGLASGDRVMICMPRCAGLVALILAVAKAGAVFTPVDPDEPVERFHQIHSDLQPFVLVAGEDTNEDIRAMPTALCYTELAQSAAHLEDGDLPIRGRPSDAAYIMFTSGSTGTPKGATVHHRGLVNRFRWQTRVHGYTSSDVFVQKSPITFDTAIWEIFIPLSIGARVVVAAHGGHRDPEYLANLIALHRISVIDFVPSMLAVFLKYCGSDGAAIRSLRHVILGGEPLPLHLLHELMRLSTARIYNQYGPTETSIGVTAWIGHPAAKQVTIGRPIDNTRIYILDPALRPLPIGAVGELFIGGMPVGMGYFGRAELTEKAFLPNPFVPGDVLYRTGDLARFSADGQIEYRGRIDSQVKIRGMRVELGEVARALLDHTSVRESFVALTGEPERSELTIYYVRSSPVQASQLRQHMAKRLPRHMLPTHYVELNSFPLTANGKVNAKALPRPVKAATADSRPLENTTQHALARLWGSLLSVHPASLDDDFFELGGHSLLATQLVTRIRDELHASLTLRDVFEVPSLEAMSERVERQRYAVEAFEI